MDRYSHPAPRASSAFGSASRDPIPDAIGESIWLGGEALIAPEYFGRPLAADRTHKDDDADPLWQVI